MKKLSKAISIILCAVLLFAALPMASVVMADSSTIADWDYTVIDAKNNVKLVQYNGTDTVVQIPSTFVKEGVTYTVYQLGTKLFAGDAPGNGANVTEVTIPSTVLYTQTNIFDGNANVTKIVINSNGIQLSRYFARNTSNLETFQVNGWVKSVEYAAFNKTNASTLAFPEGLTTVEDYAFNSDCITDITIPSTITTVTGDQVIYSVSEGNMRSITIRVPDTKTEKFVRDNFKWNKGDTNPATPTPFYGPMVVGDGFESDPGKWQTDPDKPAAGDLSTRKYIGTAEKAVVPSYNWQGLPIDHVYGNGTDRALPKTLMIPETITFMQKGFSNNNTVENLIVNADIEILQAFKEMQALKTAKVNGTVNAKEVFNNCPLLETVELNDITASAQNIFAVNDELSTITLNGEVPDTSLALITGTCPKFKKLIISENCVISGANGAVNQFYVNTRNQLEEIEVHGTIDKRNAFYKFEGLKTLKIYNTATIKQTQVFRNCEGLENLWIEDETVIDADNIFENCSSIESVTLPKNAKFNGSASFAGCTSLKYVTLEDGVYAASLLNNLTCVKRIFVNGIVNVNMALGASNLIYYMPNSLRDAWNNPNFRMAGAGNATVRVIYYGDDDVLTDTGAEILVPSRDGFLFGGYYTNPKQGQPYYGQSVDFNYVLDENLSADFSNWASPRFVRAISGDVNATGNVDILDLVHFKKQLAGTLYPIHFISVLADINNDGKVGDADDLAALKQLLLGSVEAINNEITSRYEFGDVNDSTALDTLTVPVMKYDESIGFNHAPQIEYFNGKFYCCWMAGETDEDADGQMIMWSYSDDAIEWADPMVLSEGLFAKDSGDANVAKIVKYPSAFFVLGDKLYADYSVHSYDDDGNVLSTKFYRAQLNDDGVSFGEPVESLTDKGAPMPNTSVMSSFFANGYYYKTSSTGTRVSLDGETWWTRNIKQEYLDELAAQDIELCEAVMYYTDNCVYHLLLRGSDGYIWHALSLDRGLNWSAPKRTSLTNECSMIAVGQIKSGKYADWYYIVSNIKNKGAQDRNPLYMSLSVDGYEYTSIFTIETDEYEQQKDGNGKGGAYAYPSVVEYVTDEGGEPVTNFAVAYSAGKEEIWVSTFTLDFVD